MNNWFAASNANELPSPALLFYPDRIVENIRRMVRMAGGAERLRPHIKTHKCPEIVRLHLEQGITQFKCATIAEAEMAAGAGAPDVLLAYQMVGPNIGRLPELTKKFPQTTFACAADDTGVIQSLSAAFSSAGRTIDVFLDLDTGYHRTGIEPGERAGELYRLIAKSPGLRPGGLHAYDGHIDEGDLAARTAACGAAFAPAKKFRDDLINAGLPVPHFVAGGTPTFSIHAKHVGVECSPGTCVLWDFSYSDRFADLDFLHAALVLTRVISKPAGNRLCLDLGHKAIAAEKPPPRVKFLNLSHAEAVTHSEEHLVVQSPFAEQFSVGDCLYGVPRHICPTVALHSEAVIIQDSRATGRWKITARERRLTV